MTACIPTFVILQAIHGSSISSGPLTIQQTSINQLKLTNFASGTIRWSSHEALAFNGEETQIVHILRSQTYANRHN